MQFGNDADKSRSLFCLTIKSEFSFIPTSTFIIHYSPSIFYISITCVLSKRSTTAAVANLPCGARASSPSGRMRNRSVQTSSFVSIYNPSVLVHLLTCATFIWDNERKRWDASLLLPSPVLHCFISPSHKADSPLVTPAAASLKIDNKVSEMKTSGQLQARLPFGFQLLGRCRALAEPTLPIVWILVLNGSRLH